MTTRVTTSDGAVLKAYMWEPPNSDEFTPTLVMAHGWTLDHRSWEPVARVLADDANMRLVAYDQRGHGDSSLARGRMRTGGETIRALGDDLAAVIDSLVPRESPISLAGHSMGGMTIMAFAGLHPAVLQSRVRSVTLVSTSAGELLGRGPARVALAMRVASKMPLKPKRLIRPKAQRRTSFGEKASAADVAAACEQIGNTRISTLGTFYAALAAHDELAALDQLAEKPVAILVGSRDKLTPVRHARRLAECLPHASLEIIDGAGHMLTYEATETVAGAIRDGLVRDGLVGQV